jgi:hypothetical protein
MVLTMAHTAMPITNVDSIMASVTCHGDFSSVLAIAMETSSPAREVWKRVGNSNGNPGQI